MNLISKQRKLSTRISRPPVSNEPIQDGYQNLKILINLSVRQPS